MMQQIVAYQIENFETLKLEFFEYHNIYDSKISCSTVWKIKHVIKNKFSVI